MREYPDYPDEWLEPGHPKAEFWKTDPFYWCAEVDYHAAGYADVERKRCLWLAEWFRSHTGDMMGEVEYLRLRLQGELHQRMVFGALVRLRDLGYIEPVPDWGACV